MLRMVPLPCKCRGGICREERVGRLVLLRRAIPHLLGDLHRAEPRAAHRAEVGGLGAFGGEGQIVILLGRVGVQGEAQLVAPAGFGAGAPSTYSLVPAAVTSPAVRERSGPARPSGP